MGDSSATANDEKSRHTATLQHDRTLLVEAGAGTGKTSVMSGRVVLMLAEGIDPQEIAAITFTELAASELISRIRNNVDSLVDAKIPKELQSVLPEGLSEPQMENLKRAQSRIDEITCTTIHGFCYKLIRIYPAEAQIDPGADVSERGHSDLTYREIVEDWLRDRLSSVEKAGILAEFVIQDTRRTLTLVDFVAEQLRRLRSLKAPQSEPVKDLKQRFQNSIQKFLDFVEDAEFMEADTQIIAKELGELNDTLDNFADPDSPAGLLQLLTVSPGSEVVTKAGTFRKYQKRGKWIEAAKENGNPKTDGESLFGKAVELYTACSENWPKMKGATASKALEGLLENTDEILEVYAKDKRNRAQLDFDDMVFFARDLLKNHELVRQELGGRFKYVLVDEFQDTDPLQNEILWRLCGDPPKGGKTDDDWRQFKIRSGALFLVGDPKQAIYRFRNADIKAYVEARELLYEQDSTCLLNINRNFRSFPEILQYVNAKFEDRLEKPGQPGFTPLISGRQDTSTETSVVALDYPVEAENQERKISIFRESEASALAVLCSRLIGSHLVYNRDEEKLVPCRPRDIALLAPTGTELSIYENALEELGIPIATQVGKGFFHRQEIQDMIALTRLLADSRDTLALGAFLRGPIVGLTEEELMDIVMELPRWDEEPDRLGRLTINTPPADIKHDYASDIIRKLKDLYSRRNLLTPHQLLSRAIDELRIRPILKQRHSRGLVSRPIANVDQYLEFSIGFSVRGIQSFSNEMTGMWDEGEKEVEGRPDSLEDAVSLYSIHSAKGLEWPVVIPVNTATSMRSETTIVDRRNNTLYCMVLNEKPDGYDEALAEEKKELEREHIRLMYVAMTRAKDLLVIPRPDEDMPARSWAKLIELVDEKLPRAQESSNSNNDSLVADESSENKQTLKEFKHETANIHAMHIKMERSAPSRDEGKSEAATPVEESQIWVETEASTADELEETPTILGGRERGLILHKLLEEVITGETADDTKALSMRANQLIGELGLTPNKDPSKGLSTDELSECVTNTLNLPEIKNLRPNLHVEFPVYAIEKSGEKETVQAGIADALTLASDGTPDVIVDWKSDVKPDQRAMSHYQDQVRSYLRMTGANRGLIVLMTSGKIIEV